MLAVDASFAIKPCLDRVGDHARAALAQDQLVAPPLLWSEVPSVIHELAFRGDITSELARAALNALLDDTIEVTEVRPPGLTRTAWELAAVSVGRRPTTPNIWRSRSSCRAVW